MHGHKKWPQQCHFGYTMEHREFMLLMDDENPKYRWWYVPALDSHNQEFLHEQAIYHKDSQGSNQR